MSNTALAGPGEVSWELVPDSERISAIEFLATQIKRNNESIRTWRGTYAFQDKSRMEAERIARLQAESEEFEIPGYDGKSALLKIEDGIIRFAIDSESNSLNTSFEERSQKVISLGNAGDISASEMTWPGEMSFQRSIVTPEHYLYFEPTRIHGRIAVVLNMKTERGPVAFCDEVSKTYREGYSYIVDPRALFGSNLQLRFWEELSNTVDILESGKFKEEEEKGEWAANIYRGIDENGNLYYKTEWIGSTNSSVSISQTTVFAEPSGFNAIEFHERKTQDSLIRNCAEISYRI